MKKWIVFFFSCLCLFSQAQECIRFNGFVAEFNEPAKLDKRHSTQIIIYALPNGNTIPWTRGRKMEPGMDWHFDIQHIDAQTEFLRQLHTNRNIILVYVMADKKSFPQWAKETPQTAREANSFIAYLLAKYNIYHPKITLSCHSGGGRFVFEAINSYPIIPRFIERIAFLDAVYAYEDSLHTKKLVTWLKKGGVLNVTSYRDDKVIFNGKPLVSATGGAGYRSELMAGNLSNSLKMTHKSDSDFDYYSTNDKRVLIYIKNNPQGKIYHTTLVYRNGFINAMLSGTQDYNKKYRFWDENISYKQFIKPAASFASDCQMTLAEFCKQAKNLFRDRYDSLVFKMFEAGCTPRFMDEWKRIDCQLTDSLGKIIHASYYVKPDYLCVGTDTDFVRVPMQPKTAQRIANRLGAFLSTPKISDDVYKAADVKLVPEPLTEKRDSIATFFYHNTLIEKQRAGRTG
ncbi:MAG: hypothetical protein Q8909_16800, partial [Bacteroidota bacterium]|nr:hypothetical protein [Bacteroidota bacterium]